MKLLLDTHTFLWWDSEPDKLAPETREACLDRSNRLQLSVASAWEIQIKMQLGKLHLRVPLADLIADQRRTNQLELLPISLDHVLALEGLPSPHKDPFDRLLVAQANVESAVLVSSDPIFLQYPVRLLGKSPQSAAAPEW